MHFVSSTNDLREYLDFTGAKNINFSNISTDTRSISKDALFIAIKGPNFDGNKFIDQALITVLLQFLLPIHNIKIIPIQLAFTCPQ